MREKSNQTRNSRVLHNRFLIITDGVMTEQGYFERIKRLTRDSIRIISRGSKDIDKLVELVIKTKNNSEYDYVAIVCDIDQRLQSERSKQTLINATLNANRNDIIVCLSNESFEIWLLAHFCQIKSVMKNREHAQNAAIKQGIVKGRDGKEIVADMITKDSVFTAMNEVERLRGVYGKDVITSAPMTDVDRLVSKINFN